MTDCNHITWLERFTPADGSKSYWLIHSVNDSDGGVPPENPANEHMIYNFCPECGERLERE